MLVAKVNRRDSHCPSLAPLSAAIITNERNRWTMACLQWFFSLEKRHRPLGSKNHSMLAQLSENAYFRAINQTAVSREPSDEGWVAMKREFGVSPKQSRCCVLPLRREPQCHCFAPRRGKWEDGWRWQRVRRPAAVVDFAYLEEGKAEALITVYEYPLFVLPTTLGGTTAWALRARHSGRDATRLAAARSHCGGATPRCPLVGQPSL